MTLERPTTKTKQRVLVEGLVILIEQEMLVASTPLLVVLRRHLNILLDELRNRHTPPGRAVSDTVTAAKADQLRRIHAVNPEMSQQEIAYATNVNIGRVSEVLHGKRT